MTVLPTITIEELVGNTNGFADSSRPADFERGVETAGKMECITIAVNNVWGGRSKDGASVSSYEKIGYHAGSIDFIKGALSVGCPVRAYRWRYGGLMEFEVVAA